MNVENAAGARFSRADGVADVRAVKDRLADKNVEMSFMMDRREALKSMTRSEVLWAQS